MDTKVSLKELLEAGCHFGHQSQRWHPKASSFIYTERDGIHIIDLVKTKDGLEKAAAFVKNCLSKGGKIIFLGTKRQAKEIIKEEAKRAGAFFVCEHWPAGMLTNFDVMKKNLSKMKEYEELLKSEEGKKKYTKRELVLFEKELKKLELVYGGIHDLVKIPEALYVVDIKKEAGAVKEAVKMGVSVIGITDTNSDPSFINFPIPGNDDATGSIVIITKYIADAAVEGMRLAEKAKADMEKAQSAKLNPSTSLRTRVQSQVKSFDYTQDKSAKPEKSEEKEKEKKTEEVKLEELKKAPKKKTGRIAKDKAAEKKVGKKK